MTPIARLLALRVDLRDPDAAAEVAPEALAAYAERTGWTLATTTGAHRVYHRGAGELKVPITSGWPDYGRAIAAEINLLAEHEGRSLLAIWAELVGWRDVAAEQAGALDRTVATMVAAPRMYGTTSEAVLFQALLALETAAALRGEPEVGARYDALRARHRIPSSLHASSRIGLDGIGAFIAELAGLPIPETPLPCHDVAPGEATGAPDEPEGVPPSAAPATGQGTLPGIDPGGRRRRPTRHVFGGFEARSFPAGPLAPEATTTQLVRACRHCDCLHRVASAGPRLGSVNLYSADGVEWHEASPVCIAKRPKE